MPAVRLPAVIQLRRPLPTLEIHGSRTVGERLAVKPVFVIVVVTLHHLARRSWRDTLLAAFIIYTCMDSQTFQFMLPKVSKPGKLLRETAEEDVKCICNRECNY